MKISTVKGTNDYLPMEVELRDYLQGVILNTYRSNGFQRVQTPIIEEAENLDKSEGGENLNLIFKILKRGDKLTKTLENQQYDDLADLGLRYDLTLPLSRYYANNRAKLMLPFKCIQIDKVYRAERPQKGRLREFVQCDIDIIGMDSKYAEVELIHTTAKALLALNIQNFNVKINDRRILRSILLGVGFEEEQLASVSIIFDKYDKIGCDGIRKELEEKGYPQAGIDGLINILNQGRITLNMAKELCDNAEAMNDLEMIMKEVEALSQGLYTVTFDISLVRGQGYYTGTIFEIESLDFKGSIAGGGRYDHLIGKFLNETVPAVGFSIGFERIFSIMMEKGAVIPNQKKKAVVLYEIGQYKDANDKAEELRGEYDVALYEKPKKVGKFLNRLKEQGYTEYFICGKSEGVEHID